MLGITVYLSMQVIPNEAVKNIIVLTALWYE